MPPLTKVDQSTSIGHFIHAGLRHPWTGGNVTPPTPPLVSTNPYASIKLTDQTVSVTTLTNDADLSVLVGAGETWIIRWSIAITSDPVDGAKFAVTVPSGATLQSVIWGPKIFNETTSSGAGMVVIPGAAAANVWVEATVVAPAAQDYVRLQFAKQNSVGTPVVVKTGSGVYAIRH